MKSRQPFLSTTFCTALALSFVGLACSNSSKIDVPNVDAGTCVGDPASCEQPEPDSGVENADSGVHPDAEPMLPCLHDQGGTANRGCESGEVCNLRTGECGPGKACTTNTDCDACSEIFPSDRENCGHGFILTAWCDPDHGNVCTRSRAPCETCTTDSDCGRVDPLLDPGNDNPPKCLEYEGGEKFCGRDSSLSCPDGFVTDNGQCRRPGGCPAEPDFCPGEPPCSENKDQICSGDRCGQSNAEGLCVTNDLTGAVGLCLGACQDNDDCEAPTPICNPRNGLCIEGCTKGSCAGGESCHVDGFCAPVCNSHADCEQNVKYGPDTHCNLVGQPAPRLYKSHRDPNSCAPLGCEEKLDCGLSAGIVCDKTQTPPACAEGCYTTEDDCEAGFVCKDGPPGSYDRAGCRALPNNTDETNIGVCCNPGCTNRQLQCGWAEFCCGEENSPYEDPSTCLPLVSTATDTIAEAGQCMEATPDPWCQTCGSPADCDSGWVFGQNQDPNINGGAAFQEQEWCWSVAMGVNVCSVTCNPNSADHRQGCPRLWNCEAVTYRCMMDADCGGSGITCVGVDNSASPPTPGYCQCGANGSVTTPCSDQSANLGTVTNPRCVEDPRDTTRMICVGGYNCMPPAVLPDPNGGPGVGSYPAACFP